MELPSLQQITDADREAIARVEHDVNWSKDRRGYLAVTVDIKDAERVLGVVERLGKAVADHAEVQATDKPSR